MHVSPRDRSVTSSIWAGPFPHCHLLDVKGCAANANISQSAAICCSDLTRIESRRREKGTKSLLRGVEAGSSKRLDFLRTFACDKLTLHPCGALIPSVAWGLGGLPMKSKNVTGALCAALFAMTSPSQASVVDTFTVSPNPINAGASSLLDLNLSITADPGYFNAQFTGGTVTLYSGVGPQDSFTITPGINPQDFQQSYIYPLAGNFFPSFTVTANYSEQYQVYQQTGQYWQSSGYWYYYSYSCGFFSTCTGSYWVDTSHWVPLYGYVTYTATGSFSDRGNLSLVVNPLVDGGPAQATPLPAALPLFAGGLGVVALLARRRKQKRAA
jgi:hypothetical protein